MREKYLIQIYDLDGKLKKEEKFKTKPEIKSKYNCDIQTIDKIIKMNNTENYILKKKHSQYTDYYKQFKILLIKPEINI